MMTRRAFFIALGLTSAGVLSGCGRAGKPRAPTGSPPPPTYPPVPFPNDPRQPKPVDPDDDEQGGFLL